MPESLFDGLNLLLNNLWLVPVGVLAGMFYGGMPGLTSSGTLAMLLPVLIVISPVQGLILGVSMYAGAEMGNSFPSVMLNIPGTPAGAVTAFDGYPMMQKGEASRALGICIMASTVGAIMAGIAALAFAPSIAQVALKFGSPEICIVIIFGLAVIAQLSVGGLAKGLLSGFVGLSLATTGTDPTFGQFRGTFDITYLFDKLPIVAVLVGLLGLSEALFHAESGATTLLRRDEKHAPHDLSAAKIWQGLKTGFMDVLRMPAQCIRAGIIGLGIGAVPGAGGSVATFIAYQQAIASASPERKKMFRKGAHEGLIAADASNNAMVGGALIPVLTLGIPGSAAMAVLIAVMDYHGLSLGPRLFSVNGDVAYAVILSQFFAAFFILVIGTGLAFLAYRTVAVDLRLIIPIVAVFCLIGSFAEHNYIFDMGMMVLFACIGYIMKKYDFSVVGILMGVILGPMFEAELMRSLRMGFGSPKIFFESAITQILWALFILTFAVPPALRYIKRYKNKRRLKKSTDAA
ncbi:MAG: tripartite tricarboxylate transporter permease [Rhodospirillales bacterium]